MNTLSVISLESLMLCMRAKLDVTPMLTFFYTILIVRQPQNNQQYNQNKNHISMSPSQPDSLPLLLCPGCLSDFLWRTFFLLNVFPSLVRGVG